MCTLADIPSQSAAHGQRGAPTRGDYEAVAKHTRLASSRGSTRPEKKPHPSLTTKLAKELLSPRHASEITEVAVEIPMPTEAIMRLLMMLVPP